MGLLDWFFSFSGRIGRSRFWLGLLGVAIAGGLDAQLDGWLKTIIGLAVLWAFWALVVKRAHDRGRSAVFALAMALPFLLSWLVFVSPLALAGLLAGGPIGLVLGGALGGLVFAGWALVGGLWFVIDLGLMPGEKLYNRYGQPPRALA